MVLPFTVRIFCSRNFARVRDKVSLTVLNSAASTRLAIASSIGTGRSLWRFGHFFQEPVRQPSFHIFVARKIYETHAKNNIALTRNSIAGGLRGYTIPSCRQVVLLQAG
jgi:hypothetical protein